MSNFFTNYENKLKYYAEENLIFYLSNKKKTIIYYTIDGNEFYNKKEALEHQIEYLKGKYIYD